MNYSRPDPFQPLHEAATEKEEGIDIRGILSFKIEWKLTFPRCSFLLSSFFCTQQRKQTAEKLSISQSGYSGEAGVSILFQQLPFPSFPYFPPFPSSFAKPEKWKRERKKFILLPLRQSHFSCPFSSPRRPPPLPWADGKVRDLTIVSLEIWQLLCCFFL